MKSLFRNIFLYTLVLFLLDALIPGVHVVGGFFSYLFGGVVLTFLHLILRPILAVFAMPLNILTFGASSFIITVVILYILTVCMPQVSISAFTFSGSHFAGFVIPKVEVNTFFAYILSATTMSLLVSLIEWLKE
jgi:putative membrane protein